ncbi:MAG: VWA domain-containing protein [Deltaproteobacteria bacterium]|nr:VWA domain-containing protein [Deltaproteobacteria bacterium]
MKTGIGTILFTFCFIFTANVTFAKGFSTNKIILDIELDREIFYTGKPVKAVLKVSVKSRGRTKRRVPVNLAILIDRSASMKGAKMQMALRSAIYAAKRLGKNDIVSIVTYGNSVETVIPAGTSFNEEDLAKVNSIQPSGNTALFSGISRAIHEIRKNLNKNFINRIIIISDGFANIGITDTEDFERLGASLKKERISVSTIGIGTEYNEDLMVGISQKSSGNSYFVETAKKLLKVFETEISLLTSVVARDISLKIKCQNGVIPIRIVGREGRINNSTITLNLDQLCRYQKKFALLEIIVPKGKSLKNIGIASANVTYEDPLLKRDRDIEGAISASYSDKENIVKSSENYDVQKSYIKNLNAISNEKALKLLDKGKKKEAVSELKESTKRLREAVNINKDEDVLLEAEEMKQDLEEVTKKGKFSKKKRKFLKMKSFKTRNQQAD